MNRHAAKGFTLIELMVVIAIVGIIAAIAIPSYTEQVRKGRRADAVRAIGELQLRQERWRAENPAYATQAQIGTLPISDFYTLAVAAPTDATTVAARTQYSLTATRAGAQTGDRCGTLTGTQAGKPTWGTASCN
ncbi:MAG TPA: type IV pilin protein [Luteimonas sp.]|nr:type IV pilin protein [Luteimonas sp.]